MPILLLLAAAAGAAAIGPAAPPSAAPFIGRGAGSAWAPAPPGAHRLRSGWQAHPTRRMGHDRRHGGRGLAFEGGFGLGVPYGAGNPYGNGFFARGGGAVSLRGDRPYYDYDRSYPYEWAPERGPPPEWEQEASPVEPPPPRCALEYGVRVCRGW